MITGIYVRHHDWLNPSRDHFESVTRESCWKCGRPNPDLAHGVFEYIAALLSERLREALDGHIAEHGCDKLPGGPAHCEESWRLFRLLPEAEQVLIA